MASTGKPPLEDARRITGSPKMKSRGKSVEEIKENRRHRLRVPRYLRVSWYPVTVVAIVFDLISIRQTPSLEQISLTNMF